MLAGGSPWVDRRVGDEVLERDRPQGPADVLERRLFLLRYADLAPTGGRREPGPSGVLDRWLLAELHARSPTWTRRWRTSTPPAPAARLAGFVDDLSNWYIRRSRRRFWQAEPSAMATLHESLRRQPPAGAVRAVRHRLPVAAPAGEGGAGLPEGTPDSVHLAPWPEVTAPDDAEGTLRRRWRWSAAWWSWAARRGRRPGSGRASRSRARSCRPRLRRARGRGGHHPGQERELLTEIAEELNVAAVEPPGRTLSRSRSSRTSGPSGSASGRACQRRQGLRPRPTPPSTGC